MQLWRQWVGIADPLNPADTGIQGFLKLSVAVVGPGGRLPQHTQKEIDEHDERSEQASHTSASSSRGHASAVASLCLLPPVVACSVEFLVVSVITADGLPKMDTFGGIDPYVTVQVRLAACSEATVIVSYFSIVVLQSVNSCACLSSQQFAGNPPLSTQYKKVTGVPPYEAHWNEDLWLPVLAPTMANMIKLTVCEADCCYSAGVFMCVLGCL